MYREVRPGANYKNSLPFLSRFTVMHPQVATKSGLMLGLGDTIEEIIDVLENLREHNLGMLALGQYLHQVSIT